MTINTLLFIALGIVAFLLIHQYLARKIGWRRSSSYSCFVLGAMLIAIFDVTRFGAERGYEYEYVAFMFLTFIIAIIGIVGFAISLPDLTKESPLMAVILFTVALVALAFTAIMTRDAGLAYIFLLYARLYALACLAAPVAAVVKTSRKSTEQDRINK